jgi:5-methylcytosine-specific restriction endonuclease McrA
MASPSRRKADGTGHKPRRGHSHSKGEPAPGNSAELAANLDLPYADDDDAGSDDLASLMASGAGGGASMHRGHHDLSDFAIAGAGGGAGAAAFSPGLAAKVLVLNKLYMAVRVISAKRAFCMLMQQAAEVVHVEDGQYLSYDFETWAELSEIRKAYEAERFDWVRTVRIEIAVPKVIRLLGYDRLPEQHVKLNRRNLFARDRNQCQYCGKHFPTSDLSIDHVKPRAHGGGDTWENLVCACIRCNAKKGGRTPDQAGVPLIRKPVRPKRNPMITVRLGQERYQSWRTFLDHAYWSVELR